MNPSELGRLEKVELRKYFKSESQDFTPWLAAPNNIKLLGAAGSGQPQHPQTSVFIRSFPAHRSSPFGPTLRMALHPQTRQLVEHGRIRARRFGQAMSRSPHPRSTHFGQRNQRLAKLPQQTSRQGQLALHYRQRPR